MSQGGIINEYPQNMFLWRRMQIISISFIYAFITSHQPITSLEQEHLMYNVLSYIALTHYGLVSPSSLYEGLHYQFF